jgi:diaminohydroxyphosphoribosylaminopyrimidine deaminase / 5-amino-6-(5-phosphoribosylamino)uracil reductase
MATVQSGWKKSLHVNPKFRVDFLGKNMNRPVVLIKAAISVDGKIATKTGDSQWISNEASRLYVHHLRKSYDAILVGVETLIQDNPRLTARIPQEPVSSPYRIILDSQGRSPITSHVFTDEFKKKTILATTSSCQPSLLSYLEQQQVKVLILPADQGRVRLKDLMEALYQMGIHSVFVEGGGEVIASLLKHRLVDKVSVAIGPLLIGGKEARSFMGGEGATYLKDAIQLSRPQVRLLDSDVILEYEVL